MIKLKLTKKEKFESLPGTLIRLSPYVITETGILENKELLNQTLAKLFPYVILEKISTPRKLFEFLKVHMHDTIIVTDDIFSKRKNYIDIIEGAVCSSPDSGMLWPVRYLNEPKFTFKGKLILCTNNTKKVIYSDKKFKNFKRDCIFI